MDRNQKFTGREKHVTGGTGSINKVGEGRGKTQSQRGSGGGVGGGNFGGGSSGGRGNSGGSGNSGGPRRAGGGLAKLSPLAVIVVVLYMLFGGGGSSTTTTTSSGGSQSYSGSSSGSSSQVTSFHDYFTSGAGQSSSSGSASGSSNGSSSGNASGNSNGTSNGSSSGSSSSSYSSSAGSASYGSNSYYTAPATTEDNNTGSVDLAVSNKARSKFTKLLGSGKDTATIMIYLCGTDLESNYAMATNDLQEMINASIDTSRVKVIIYTGGCKRWKNSVFSSSTNEIYQVVKRGVERLSANEGNVPMTDPSTLSGFIQYCKKKFPASRYGLIFWDHGGGTLSGFGNDQKFPSSGTMSLAGISRALEAGGVKFDFVGFDACLMATLENAMAVEPYADYLIASEETEPGYGWYYTSWLKELSKNPSTDTLSLGKIICDTFTSDNAKRTRGDSTTLSVVDLAEAAGTIPEALDAFASTLNDNIRGDQYVKVANARAATLEFAASTKIDQIDLIDFCTRINTKESNTLANALRGIIKYNRTSSNFRSAFGMAAYFPYRRMSYVDTVLTTLDRTNYNQNYQAACRSFASLVAGGQVSAGGSSSPLYQLLGGGYGSSGSSYGSSGGSSYGNSYGSSSGYDYGSYGGSNGSAEIIGQLFNAFLSSRSLAPGVEVNGLTEENSGWLDTDLIKEKQEEYAASTIDASQLTWTDKNGESVLSLSDETWDLIEKIEFNVFYDDGTGYLDLGVDNIVQFDEDGDFVGTWDGTWLALDGQIAPYYVVLSTRDESTYTIIGRIPAILNDETDCNVIVKFTSEDPEGTVVGISTIQNYNQPEQILGKVEPINAEELAGAKVTFATDYYTYEGEFVDQYTTGNSLTIDPEHKIEISNVALEGAENAKAMYKVTDVYANEFWTPDLPK